MARRKFIQIALPAAVAVTPVLVGAVKAWSNSSHIWLWGDQALIDLEARNSLLGRNLLGVYDRFGWHHLGPLWLQVLGVFRWLGGGSAVAVATGFYFLQALAVIAIVVVAHRLRPGLTAWWAALALVGYQWSFGLERLGTIWAPYAIALPTALLVLLVADMAVSRDPWPATIAAAVCASFLCQTDVGTVVLVLVVVVAAPFVRALTRAAVGADGQGASDGSSAVKAWGWGTENWPWRAGTLVAVLGVLWLATAIQQLSTRPGNLVQAYRFLTTHHTARTVAVSLRAADTVFGFFPFRFDEDSAIRDADPRWLVTHSAWDHPWYLLYIVGTIAVGIAAVVYRRLAALALATTTSIAILAAGWSILLVYGPLYPYLVLWTGVLVVPAWIAAWLVLAPVAAPVRRDGAPVVRRSNPQPTRRLVVPAASAVAAVAVCTAFAGSTTPLTDGSAHYARSSWDAVARATLAPGIKTVYVDIASQDAMPEAAAIADQVVRHHRRLEVNRDALYFLDPSFAPKWKAQLRIVVCCGRGDPGTQGRGLDFRAIVNGQRIYTLSGRPTLPHARLRLPSPAPGIGRFRLRFNTYLDGDLDGRLVRAL